jgi:hypothetical protein
VITGLAYQASQGQERESLKWINTGQFQAGETIRPGKMKKLGVKNRCWPGPLWISTSNGSSILYGFMSYFHDRSRKEPD